jgi:UDP-N-acetylglucosamine 2-epimerase (non-hydrolysing)
MIQNSCGPIILIIGTRPEGIKMIPVYFALKNAGYNPLICSTMQHDELLLEVFELFEVKPDFDLSIMRLGQDLFYLTQSILQKTKEIFIKVKPSLVLVQGDTTSTMAAALSAFYLGIPIGHIEAGLRTDSIYEPFPEEMNRRVVGTIATYHFAPTSLAVANLFAQGIARTHIFCTGNTVVDALRIIKEKIKAGSVSICPDIQDKIAQCKAQGKKIILLTAHRRESFDGGILRILASVKQFLLNHSDVICFYPFHPNPHVIQAMYEVGLSSLDNIYLTEPLPYKDMAYLLTHADLVLTDSGGIQEEAVCLGKPVLVLREKTERMEGVWAGLAHIVGTNNEKILSMMKELLFREITYPNYDRTVYGNGYAAEKIVTILQIQSSTVGYAKQTHTLKNDVAATHKKKEKFMKICMLGLGYIGLPTSILASEYGFEVKGFDVDQERVARINKGDPVIHEPEIYERLQVALGSGRFKAVNALEPADFFIIAVPTPFKENKKADLSYVFNAAELIRPLLSKGNVVIIESTIPVGTTDHVAKLLEEKTGLKAGVDFYVAPCPERVLPGKIFQELVENDRIIGGINQDSVNQAAAMYKQFAHGQLYLTDATTAEMVKLVENSSRDVQIAFANQVASMAYSIGLNPYEVIELANKHPRVNILNPSCGVGGHCIAVDPWFLVESFPEHTALLKAARHVNDEKPHEVINCIKSSVAAWQKSNQGTCKVAALGLTYKADVDDLRESPALEIAYQLRSMPDIELLVCEPHVNKTKLHYMFGDAAVSYTQAIEQADILVFLVSHKRFKACDQKIVATKKVIDYCGMFYEPKKKTDVQELMFWPAKSTMDYFKSMQEPLPLNLDNQKEKEEHV